MRPADASEWLDKLDGYLDARVREQTEAANGEAEADAAPGDRLPFLAGRPWTA